MATTASTEASEIRRRGRRRLIGAIVLVVLAVVFIPMVLDSEPKPKQAVISTDIPPKDTAPPLPPPAASTPAKSIIPPETAKAVVAVDPATHVAPAQPVIPAEAGTQQKSTQAAPAKADAVSESPKLEGFAVQVGAFKDEAKLTAARQKLVAAKIPHFVERRGDLNRLRAGPYPTREAAEKALASVKAASLNGQVVPLP